MATTTGVVPMGTEITMTGVAGMDASRETTVLPPPTRAGGATRASASGLPLRLVDLCVRALLLQMECWLEERQ